MGRLSDELGKGKEALDEAAKSINDLGRSATEAFTNLSGKLGELAKNAKNLGQGGNDLVDSFSKSEDVVKKLIASTDKLSSFDKRMINDKKSLNTLFKSEEKIRKSLTSIASEQRRIAIELKQSELDGNKDLQKSLLERSKLLQDAQENAEEVLGTYEEISKVNDKISKETKWADTLAESLGSIPGVGPMISGPFKAASAATRDARSQGKGFLASMTAGLGELVSAKTLIAGLVTIVFEADKKTTSFARNLQISKEAARDIKETYTGISLNSDKAYLNVHNLMEAQTQLTDEMGMAVQFSDDQVKNQAFLTKQLGLSEKSAAKFAKYQTITGKSAKETNEEIADSVANLKKETGIAFKLNDVFEEVADANAGLKAAYGFNNKLLAEQVVQTKKLGINLQQAESIASSMLDFESSIQDELAAELLTGKNINLEEARRLALMGKSSEAAAEILNQVGSTEDLMKMNVIQQQALAKAAGMERNELIASVKEREIQEKLGGRTLEQLREAKMSREEIAEITGEELLKQMEQESAAAKFEAAVIKIKDALAATLEGPLGSILEGLASALSSSTAIYGVLIGLGALSFGKTIAQFATMAALQSTTAVGAVTAASAISFGIGLIAITAAVTAAIMSMNAAQDKAAQNATNVGDMLGTADGKTQVSPREGGIFELSDNDDFVAAPGAAEKMNQKSTNNNNDSIITPGTSTKTNQKGGGAVVQDNAALLAKIDQLITINTRIAQVAGNRKQDKVTLEMFGNEVGQGINTAEREVQ